MWGFWLPLSPSLLTFQRWYRLTPEYLQWHSLPPSTLRNFYSKITVIAQVERRGEFSLLEISTPLLGVLGRHDALTLVRQQANLPVVLVSYWKDHQL